MNFDDMGFDLNLVQHSLENNFGMTPSQFGAFKDEFQKEHLFDTNQHSNQEIYRSGIEYMKQEQAKQDRIAREERLADIASAKMTSDAFNDLGRSLDSFGRTGVGFLG